MGSLNPFSRDNTGPRLAVWFVSHEESRCVHVEAPRCTRKSFDVVPEAIPEHDEWHTHEHFPETQEGGQHE
jgi:hypothetical protein